MSLKPFILVIILILSGNIIIQGQVAKEYSPTWEIRFAPYYYFAQATPFNTKAGNFIEHKGGVLGSIYIGRNFYIDKSAGIRFTLLGGFSFYNLLDLEIHLERDKPISAEYLGIAFSIDKVGTSYFTHTYFEFQMELHQRLWNSSWFISGGAGFGVLPRKVSYDWYIHHHLPSDYNDYIVSAYLIGNYSEFPLLLQYSLGIEKIFTLEQGHFGLALKWNQSFNPYISGDLYLIEEDFSYARKSYNAYARNIEFQLIIPFL